MNTVAGPVIPEQNNNEIHTIVINESVIESVDDLLKNIIYSRASSVRILSIIDMIFLLINFIIYLISGDIFWVFCFFFPLCYCGNKGANEYNINYLKPYLIYQFIMFIFYILVSFLFNNFIILLVSFIEGYLLFYTSRFYSYLKNSSPEMIESLRDGWNPDTITYYYY